MRWDGRGTLLGQEFVIDCPWKLIESDRAYGGCDAEGATASGSGRARNANESDSAAQYGQRR